MQKAIMGKKIGMTQIFDENGNVIPVTVIEAGPCMVISKKTQENDGYEAIVMGYEDIKLKKLNKPNKGLFDKTGTSPKKHLKEYKLEDCASLNIGDIVKADTFATGDKVDIKGTSKGKGYQGTVKRYNTARLKETHGTGPVHRHAGSNGACSSPSRVMKGKKLPGQMGNETVTVQNLEIVKVDTENNLIAVKGAVPGSKGSLVSIVNSVKA